MKVMHSSRLWILTMLLVMISDVRARRNRIGSNPKKDHHVKLQQNAAKFGEYTAESVDLKKRPIYNVAHMVNGDTQVNADWVNQANAIEADLMFNPDGSADEFFHGIPCDFLRVCTYSNDPLSHFALIRLKAQDEGLALFWLDMKLTGSGITDFYSSGLKIAELMTSNGSLFPLGENVPLNVLLGAEKLEQKDFFLGFREYIISNRPELLKKFGYGFGLSSNDPNEILTTFEEIGITENVWVGDGAPNYFFWRSHSRLEKILSMRDSYVGSGLAPFKVYAWTIDKTSTMRELLQLGVDVIINNYPDRLQRLVQDEFHDSLVFATPDTNPWERIRASEAVAPLAQGCDQSYCWKYVDVEDWCWTETTCSEDRDCWGDLSCA